MLCPLLCHLRRHELCRHENMACGVTLSQRCLDFPVHFPVILEGSIWSAIRSFVCSMTIWSSPNGATEAFSNAIVGSRDDQQQEVMTIVICE